MPEPPRQRVPQNAPGDFYVEAGCCTQCQLPHGEAPELMNDPAEHAAECYFRRQPRNESEISRALRAIWVAELSCLRYAGRDPAIIQRLEQMQCGHCCDHRPA